ncbi:MAG: hypothetical protein R3C19_17875 [Planctomycetaceae bacterium]
MVRSPHSVAAWTRSVHDDHEYSHAEIPAGSAGENGTAETQLVILFEASADRDPLLARTQIEIIRTLLDNAEHDDTFSVITANTKATPLSEKSQRCTAKSIATVLPQLEETHLVGALDFQKALAACEEFVASKRENVLVHVGSAIPVLGEQDQSALLKALPEKTAYVGVGVGRRWSQSFMKQAASKTGGYFTQINPDEEVVWRAFELSSVLNAPRLLDVRVGESRRDSATARDTFSKETGNATPLDVARGSLEAGPGQYVESRRDSTTDLRFLNFSDTIVHGEEVCAVARLARDGELPDEVTVTGLLNGRPWQQTLVVEGVEEQADYLPRTWAKLEIDRLVSEGAAENQAAIIELSKAMYVMSPFTSLLVLENEEMYTQYNIDRGRKDHWAMYPCPEEIQVVHEPFGAGSETTAEVPQTELQKLLSSIQSLPQPQVVSYPNVYVIFADGTRSSVAATEFDSFAGETRFGRNGRNLNDPFELSSRAYSYFNLGDVDAYFVFDNDVDSDGRFIVNGDLNGNGIVPPVFLTPKLPSPNVLFGTNATRLLRSQLDASPTGEINLYMRLPEDAGQPNADGFGNGLFFYDLPLSFGEFETAGTSPQARTWFARPEISGWRQMDDVFGYRLFDNSGSMMVDGVAEAIRHDFPARAFRPQTIWLEDLDIQFRQGAFENVAEGLARVGESVDRQHWILGGGNRRWEYLQNDPLNTSVAFSLAPFYPKQPVPSGMSLVERELLETPRFDFGWGTQQLNWDDSTWMLRFDEQSVIDGFDGRFRVQQDRLQTVEELIVGQIELPRLLLGEEEQLLGLRDVRPIRLRSDVSERMIQELLQDLVVDHDFRGTTTASETGTVAGSMGNAHPWSVAPGQRREVGVQLPAFAAVSYPEFGNDRRFFGDLMSHAPGLNTLRADVLALMDAGASRRDSAAAGDAASNQTENATPVDVAGGLAAASSGQNVESRRDSTTTGHIDPTARELIDRARSLGWERVTLPGDNSLTVFVDGTGRHVYERTVSEGLLEQVVCDGDTLLHFYNEIGLAAKRDFSKFHRREIEALVPWLLPSADELARHADVVAIDERTVAVSARIAEREASNEENVGESRRDSASDRYSAANQTGTESPGGAVGGADAASARAHVESRRDSTTSVELRLVFGDVGRLMERRLVVQPSGEILLAIRYEENGTVDVINAEGNVIASVELKRERCDAPDLTPELDDVVVLPLPIRSGEHVLAQSEQEAANSKQESEDFANWSEERALALVLADSAAGNGERVVEVIRERFFDQGDKRDGLYVLLSRFPNLLVKTEAVEGTDGQTREVNLLPSPEGSPLRQFVRQWIRWQQDNSDATEFAIEGPEDGFVQRLATARNLYLRWKSGQATQDRTDAQVQVELDRMLNFVGGCRTDAMGWTLLSVVEKNLAHNKFGADFAAGAERFEGSRVLGWIARQERCRTLFQAGKMKKARRLYGELLTSTARTGTLPRIEPEMRQLFIGAANSARGSSGASPSRMGDGNAAWSKLTTELGEILLPKRSGSAAVSPSQPSVTLPRTAFLLSVQLRQLGDIETADALLDRVLGQLDAKRRPDVALLAVEQLRQLGRSGADRLLSSVMELEPLQNSSALWRYSSRVADAAGNRQLALQRLEHAIQIDFENRPDVINLESLRADYADLLNRFEAVLDASSTLDLPPPQDLVLRIVRAADQWRSIDDDDTVCCHTTARLLTKLNRDDMAWDYLTTPLAGSSGESSPWRNLAQTLTQQNQVALADIAWTRAFEFERTNPELLLSHAQMLIDSGRAGDGTRLLRKIVDGDWQPRFRSTVDEARNRLRR